MAFMGVETRSDGSLYCDISIESLGFPSFTPLCSIPIRYDGEKFREMGEIFVGVARSTCPVDTGYLRDHNDYACDAGGIEMWSEAFYSAYQEYGTSRCRAQPWFESSIMVALADSGIEDSFRETETRFGYIDSLMMEVQTANPTSIGECEYILGLLRELDEELTTVGLDGSAFAEMADQIEDYILEMEAQMMMMASMPGGGMQMSFLEQLIISIIAGFISAIIRQVMQEVFQAEQSDANPHNPSH